MKALAIITARGGSKRIPGKNIKNFLGKPIIAYSIEAALTSGIFEEVMVSTDDAQIAATAQKYGAKVPFMRSPATSDDFATTADVLLEVLQNYKTAGKKFDYFCCLYPTAPFLTAERLKEAQKTFLNSGAQALTPVVQFSFPIQRAFKIENGLLQYLNPQHARTRSQDLEKMYHDAGQFYFAKSKAFLKNKTFANAAPFILTEDEAQDIDTPQDWQMAELKYKVLAKCK